MRPEVGSVWRGWGHDQRVVDVYDEHGETLVRMEYLKKQRWPFFTVPLALFHRYCTPGVR